MSAACLQLWWLDTGWACGGVLVREGVIVRGGAPIFQRFVGQRLEQVLKAKRYRAEPVLEVRS